jgi:hypothetical protein
MATWTRRALKRAVGARKSASAFALTRRSKAASISRPVVGFERENLQPDRRRLEVAEHRLVVGLVGGIDQYGDALGCRRQVAQQLQAFRNQFAAEHADASRIAARMIEACH